MSTLAPTDDVARFRALVLQRFGLAFEESASKHLAEVLERRGRHQGRSTAEYLRQLQSPRARAEWAALAGELTIAETYLFRNVEQFRAFAEVALPERLRAARSRAPSCALAPLRVLSAGCATGEEAYSLAIQARETLGEVGAAVAVEAIDLNPAVLSRARRGRFSAWAMREIPADVRERWFERDGSGFVLRDLPRDAVRFAERNLVDPSTWPTELYDVIFCRNVLMYFSAPVASAVVRSIARALLPGGFLFLGHAETLRGLSADFELLDSHGTFYYRRSPELGAEPATAATRELAHGDDRAGAWAASIRESSERVEVLAARAADAREHIERRSADRPRRTGGDSEIGRLLARERFAEALSVLEAGAGEGSAAHERPLLRAVLLLQDGRVELAESACRDLLARGEIDAAAHYVLGLCHEARGDVDAARSQHRSAARRDPSFAMPRLHLGLLARRAGDVAAARRELTLAVALLKHEPAERIGLFGGGFGRGALLDLGEAELRACEVRP